MVAETFSERLARLVREAQLSDTEVASILGTTETQAKRVLEGSTQSLKLVPALRLCRRLGVSPFYLANEPEGPTPTTRELDRDVALLLEMVDWLETSQSGILDALEAHGLKIDIPPKPSATARKRDR